MVISARDNSTCDVSDHSHDAISESVVDAAFKFEFPRFRMLLVTRLRSSNDATQMHLPHKTSGLPPVDCPSFECCCSVWLSLLSSVGLSMLEFADTGLDLAR